MNHTFHVSILAPDRLFYEGPCESLIVPTSQGQMGILAHHSNMVAAIEAGLLEYRVPGKEMVDAAVSAGIMKVEDNEVLILVDTVESPEEIDDNRAREAAAVAKEILLQKKSMEEYRLAQAGLAREINRLRVKNRYDALKK